jgi:tetratricopeptide (TPR) repeat protein
MISDASRYVILGRLKAYLNKFQESLDTFSEGIERNPDSPHLYRHRAHRWITLRDFDRAISDFERAIELVAGQPDEIEFYQPEVEQDIAALILGRPGDVRPERVAITPEVLEEMKDTYKSTLHSSIWYHYALAFYLKGDFDRAAREFASAFEKSVDDDMLAASGDWLYMSLRRSGQHGEAADLLARIDSGLHIVEPSYYRRLLLYKGEATPEQLLDPASGDHQALVTQGYGVANWYWYNDRQDEAISTMQKIISIGRSAAFGHIAAEADLARLQSQA